MCLWEKHSTTTQTLEEHIDRFAREEIDPRTTRYADCDPKTDRIDGFWVRLQTPRSFMQRSHRASATTAN